MGTINKKAQIGLLVAALIGGAVAALGTRSEQKSGTARHAPEFVSDISATEGDESHSASEPAAVEGKVSEVIQVPHYTYMQLESRDGSSVWAAVNSVPGVKTGDSVRVVQAQPMHKFHSSTLKRDFETIYFGVLEGADSAGSEPGAGGMANPPAGANIEANAVGSVNPHAQVPPEVGEIKQGSIARAKGENGFTIAELYAKKSSLVDKPIRVRAVVVKSTPDVMGKTFVHVRDGSGRDGAKELDLTVTTQEKPQLRQTLVFEGKLQLDVDLGAGYKYPLILQDARVVND